MSAFDSESIQTLEISGYDFDPESGHLQLRYALLGAGVPLTFTERVRFPVGAADVQTLEVAERLVRLLLLAASTSYYKIAAPPRVVIGVPVAEQERHFLSVLIRHGMTEFAYVNNLPQALSPTIEALDIIPAEPVALPVIDEQHLLVPVGGGKDSTVTFEALRAAGFQPTLFAVDSYQPITATVERSGLPYLEAERTIDPQLIELNQHGARNGHVPITIIKSLISLLVAVMNNKSVVVMSNERSASEGNVRWRGIDVNHQWNKGMEAEKLMRDTLRAVVSPSLEYFSLLRPLSELRIARQFATLTQYHDVFTSCNRAFHIDPSRRRIWCGQCDKCRFVFLILAPYMSTEQLEAIWHKNMFDDGEQLAGFRELLGIEGHKPLECVGEIAESRLALELAAQKNDWKHTALVPILLHDIPPEAMPTSAQKEEIFATGEHFIPDDFLAALDQIE